MTTTRAPERSVDTTTPTASRTVNAVLALLGFLVLTGAGVVAFFFGMLSGFDAPDGPIPAYFVAAVALVVAPWLVGWAVTRRPSWGVAALAVGALATLTSLWGVGAV